MLLPIAIALYATASSPQQKRRSRYAHATDDRIDVEPTLLSCGGAQTGVEAPTGDGVVVRSDVGEEW